MQSNVILWIGQTVFLQQTSCAQRDAANYNEESALCSRAFGKPVSKALVVVQLIKTIRKFSFDPDLISRVNWMEGWIILRV